MSFDAYLAQFAEPEGYLNFASYGPPSRAAAAESARLFESAVTGADSGEHLHSEDARAIAAISRLLAWPSSAIHLVPNTSLGLLQVAFAVPGGEVVVATSEFPSNVYAWWRAADAGRLTVRPIDKGEFEPVTAANVARTLTPATTAVAVSAIDFRTGHRADLGAIREAIGDRLLVVDAIQALGVADVDWSVADAIVSGGQKWARAGWGTGFLALSDRALDRLEPVLSSWTGVEDATRYDGMPHAAAPGARRFSITNGSPTASGAFASALELIESVGVAEIERVIAARAAHLRAALASADVPVAPAAESGIVGVEAPGRAAYHHQRLRDAGFTTTLHGTDRIRVSVHATTRIEALDALAATLRYPAS